MIDISKSINNPMTLIDNRENSESNKLIETIINYLFWCMLILFTNPGGIVESLNIYYITTKININDLLFVLLTLCHFIIPKEKTIFDIDYIRTKKLLLIFLTYYLIVFITIVPIVNGNLNYSLPEALIKSRYTVYALLISIYTYEFFKRRWDIFLNVFLFSSVVVLILFIATVVTKLHILQIGLVNRGFVNINRNLMQSQGIMPLLIPLGVVVIVFNLRIKYRNLILIGFTLMSIAYILELWRRNIIALFVFFILAIAANALINRRYTLLLGNTVKIILLIASLTFIAYLIFPRYINAAAVGIKESFSVLETERDISGRKDLRMTLDRPFINEKFYQHPFFGTGFDNRWRTTGGDNQGYEAADYPFLAALAMFGIIGLLVFLPIYFVIVKVLKLDFEFLRANNNKNIKSVLFLFVITFMIYFVFDLVQYFNYFQAVSNSDFYYNWYIFLSLYLAARSRLYASELDVNKVESNEFQQYTKTFLSSN